MKETLSQSMVLQVIFMMVSSLQLMQQSLVNSEESWDGLISLEHLKLELMQILQLMLRKLENLVQKVLVFCRTEHMFFEEDRIAAFREMICSDTVEEKRRSTGKDSSISAGDFEALYEALEGCQ